jgi:hypothetical protein
MSSQVISASADDVVDVPTDGSQNSFVVIGFCTGDVLTLSGYVPGTSDFKWVAATDPTGTPELELQVEEDGTDLSTTVDFQDVTPGDLSGLMARVGTSSDGSAADLVVSGTAPPAGSRTPVPVDQQIVLGGLQGFASLDDASNVSQALATGRVGLYMHQSDIFNAVLSWGIPNLPTADQLPGVLQTFAAEGGDAENELGWDAANGQDFEARAYALNQSVGYTADFANVNVGDGSTAGLALEPFTTLDGLAWWDTRVDEARGMGIENVAPIMSPNSMQMVAIPWTSPTWNVLRQEALYGGGITLDSPPSFFYEVGPGWNIGNAYQTFTEQETQWGNAEGIRTTWIVSDYGAQSSYLTDAQDLVSRLVQDDAVPAQWTIENYAAYVGADYANAVGSETTPNTQAALALWFAQNAPVTVNGVVTFPSGSVLTAALGRPSGEPVLMNQAPDLRLTEGQAFFSALPPDGYADPDGGSISYAATLTGGNALPSWLNFDTANGTFFGMAPLSATPFNVTVVATTSEGHARAEAFEVYPQVPLPLLSRQQDDIRTVAGQAFATTLPANSFTDPAGGTLSYAATLQGGSALPSWLVFDTTTSTLSGTAPTGASNTPIVVVATSSEGYRAAEGFCVYGTVSPPVLAHQQGDVHVGPGQAVSIALTPASFTDPEGGTVSLWARQSDGSALPSWLSFDAAQGVLSGTSPASGANLQLAITATTSEGGQASEGFRLVSAGPTPVLQAQAPDQRDAAGSQFSFSLPSDSYTDPAGGTVAYAAELSSGSPLPGWFGFDAAGSQTFSGTVPDSSAPVGITVSATTSEGSTSLEAFKIYPTAVAPFMESQTPDERLAAGTAFSFALPNPVFFDPAGGSVGMTAENVDLTALPSWLSFNASTDTFSGTTPTGSGGIGIRLDAQTPSAGTAAQAFHLYWGGGTTSPDLVPTKT